MLANRLLNFYFRWKLSFFQSVCYNPILPLLTQLLRWSWFFVRGFKYFYYTYSNISYFLSFKQRRKVVSSLVHKPDDGKDKSSEPQIPSLVRVTPRPLRKDAIQPNKKLLLLAVADAEKSVSRPHKRHSSPSNSSHAISRKVSLFIYDLFLRFSYCYLISLLK